MSRSGTHVIKEVLLISEIRKICRQVHPDLIISHTTKPNIYFNLVKGHCKSIAVVNGLGISFSEGNNTAKWVTRLYKFALRKNCKVVYQNKYDAKYLEELDVTSAVQSVIIPGSGVDTDKFYLEDRMLPTESLKLIYVGRLLRSKGVPLLVDAINKLEQLNISLTIVGEIDPQNPDSISQIDVQELEKNEKITYLGFRNDIADLMRGHHVLVFPSYYNEGLPRVILEAMATGLPCIVADINGTRDVIQHEVQGIITRPKNLDDLVAAIIRMRNLDREEYLSMQTAARQTAQTTYSLEKINQQYKILINESYNIS